MHGFVLDEAELGFRVACALDSEEVWGAYGEYLILTMRFEDLGPSLDEDDPF